MKCSRCGIDLIESANFCHGCGLPIKPENEREAEAKFKLVASNLSAFGEHETYKLEEIVKLLTENPDSVRKIEYNDAGDLIFHIFTAWH